METNSSILSVLTAKSNMVEIEPKDVKEGCMYYIADHVGRSFKSLREVVGIYENKRIIRHPLEDDIDINRYHFRVIYYAVNGVEDVTKRGTRVTRIPADWGMEKITEISELPSYIFRLISMIGACI